MLIRIGLSKLDLCKVTHDSKDTFIVTIDSMCSINDGIEDRNIFCHLYDVCRRDVSVNSVNAK